MSIYFWIISLLLTSGKASGKVFWNFWEILMTCQWQKTHHIRQESPLTLRTVTRNIWTDFSFSVELWNKTHRK